MFNLHIQEKKNKSKKEEEKREKKMGKSEKKKRKKKKEKEELRKKKGKRKKVTHTFLSPTPIPTEKAIIVRAANTNTVFTTSANGGRTDASMRTASTWRWRV